MMEYILCLLMEELRAIGDEMVEPEHQDLF